MATAGNLINIEFDDFTCQCRNITMPPGDRCSVLDYMLEKEYPGHNKRRREFIGMKVNAIMAKIRAKERGEF